MSGPAPGREGPGGPGDERAVEGSDAPAQRSAEGPGATDPVPLTDPAHRAARWVMILAPILLVVAVFLLLRLSTG